jgi:hypothetical protein
MLEGVFAMPDEPTALVVHSTFVGQVTEVADEMNVRLGSDISLVSIGISSWQGLRVPNLAAVEADNQALGTLACYVMLDWIAGIEPKAAYSELARDTKGLCWSSTAARLTDHLLLTQRSDRTGGCVHSFARRGTTRLNMSK